MDNKKKERSGKRGVLLMYLAIFGLFITMVSNRLFSEGMFMDGIYYADVALNMAEGNGDFWHPQYTDIEPFYGHPPLAMWLESFLYRLFGDHIAVEKSYSMAMVLISMILTVLLWCKCGGKKELGWLPLLLLTLIPAITDCASDNLLENTMMVFTLLTALFIINGKSKRHYLNMVLSGLAVTAAFLTKGFTGIYPLIFPLLLWLVVRKRSLLLSLLDCIVIGATAIITIGCLCLFCDGALEFLDKYMDIQVLSGVKSQIVESRFTIIAKFLERSAIVLIILAIVMVATWISNKKRGEGRLCNGTVCRYAVALLMLVACGVLPIMVSMKQRAFYILTVYPFLAVAAGLLMQTTIEKWITKLGQRTTTIAAVLALLTLGSGTAMSIRQIGRPSHYDPILLSDMKKIMPNVEPHSIIGMDASMRDEWSLAAYYYRWGRINVQPVAHDTMLLRNECSQQWLESHSEHVYIKEELNTEVYHLYVRTKAVDTE